MAKISKPVCFFVTPIGPADSPQRGRLDRLMEYILKPALGSSFEIQRADKISRRSSITHQIFKLLLKADLVVTDLTGLNPNVLYETGIRHAVNKPTILLIDKSENIPFDINHERTIIFDITDLASVSDAKDTLRRMVRKIADNPMEYRSPFNLATGYAPLKAESENGQLEIIQDSIDEVNSNIEMLDLDIDTSSIASAVSELAWETKMLKYEIEDLKRKIK